MAREKGTFINPANYEPQIAAPFDARSLVSTRADLSKSGTWRQTDGSIWLYSGIIVAVWKDPVIDNNGLYFLKDAANFTVAENWIKFADVNQIVALEEKIANLDTSELQVNIINGGNASGN